MKLATIIMAGGTGDRLWPLVCHTTPKVCLSIDGSTSLLGMTLDRLKPFAAQGPVWIVTSAQQRSAVVRAVPIRHRVQIIAEPEPRNTAACIALAAAGIAERDPKMVMVLLPADHWIPDVSIFQRSVQAAISMASEQPIVATIGLKPTPNGAPPSVGAAGRSSRGGFADSQLGLGHLCAGRSLGSRHGRRVFALRRFVEKPSAAVAKRLLRQRGMYWNAGMFIAQAGVLVDLIRRHLPIHARWVLPLGSHIGKADFARAAQRAYRHVPNISFDDGIMAKARRACIVDGGFRWEDLGSWESWSRLSAAQRHAQLQVGTQNVRIVSSNGHLVAAVGVQDLIIVQTPRATLICHAGHSQAVRSVVSALRTTKTLRAFQ